MPAYSASPSTVGAQHGIPVPVWINEQPASGSGRASASCAVALPDSSYDKMRPFGVSIKFAAAPTGFEIDIQVSDTDVDNQYQTMQNGNLTTFDAVNNTVRVDCPYNMAQFVRLLMRTQPGVTVSATITP